MAVTDPIALAPSFDVDGISTSFLANVDTLIVPRNLARVYLRIFVVTAAAAVAVWPRPMGNDTARFQLLSPVTYVELSYSQAGMLCGMEWWARSTNVASVAYWSVEYEPDRIRPRRGVIVPGD